MHLPASVLTQSRSLWRELASPFVIGRKHDRWILLFLILTPLFLSLYLTFFDARPYYIQQTDVENDFYYNARLILSGKPVSNVRHPGTPIYYLGSLILLLTGSSLGAAQSFFNLAYLIIGGLLSAALYLFTVICIKSKISTVLVAVALAFTIAWPSFLVYTNYFASDAFTVVFGLPTIALFWSTLGDSSRLYKGRLLVCGLGLGLCLATKVTFIPVAIALLAAISIQVIQAIYRHHASWFCLFIAPLAMLAGFLVFTAPVFGRLPVLFLATATREDVRIEAGLIAGFLQVFSRLLKANGLLAVLLIGLIVLFLYLLSCQVYSALTLFRRQQDKSRSHSVTSDSTQAFDYISGGVFVCLLLSAFVYTLLTGYTAKQEIDFGVLTTELDFGVAFRNVFASALVIPFLLLYCYQLLRARAEHLIQSRLLQISLLSVSLATLAFAISVHVDGRHNFIAKQTLNMAEVNRRLAEFSRPDARIAFWDGSPGMAFADASFHFWGNYRYAADSFDQELLQQYPQYTYLRLREAEDLIDQGKSPVSDDSSDNPTGEQENKSIVNRIGDVIRRINPAWRWSTLFSPPYPPGGSGEAVAGETRNIQVATIAVPEAELVELGDATLADLTDLLHQRQLDVATVRKERFGATNWLLIELK